MSIDHKSTPGHWARRFQQFAVAAFQAEMEAIGCDMTPVQYSALAAIAENSGMDQATLAREIAVDRTTIMGVVDRLESKGLITRPVSVHDRRARELATTSGGRAMLERCHVAVARAQEAIVRGLSDGEREDLLRLLRKVVGM